MVTRPARTTALAIVVASAMLVGLMTLRPTETALVTPAFCVFCGSLGGVDFTLNVVLFVPFGLGLRWLTGRWKTAAIVGFAVTVIVEALQWRLVGGRDAALGDVIANTVGTMLGSWIAVQGFVWLYADRQQARRFATTCATLASLTLAASAWLLRPVQPSGLQWVQRTPIRPNMDVFRGQLVKVDLNGSSIRGGETLRPERTVDESSSQSLRVLLLAPVPSSRRQAIMIRGANDLEEAFFLAQRGQSVVYRSHIAAIRLKLRSILVGHATALSMTPETMDADSNVVIDAWSRPSEIGISVLGSDAVTLPRTVGLAWALFLPRDVALDRTLLLVNAIWLGALVLPVSFFSSRSGGRNLERTLAFSNWWPLAVVVGVLGVVPVAGLHPLTITDWAGVLAGLGTGVVLERVTRQPAIA